jgi:hypothetical protein
MCAACADTRFAALRARLAAAEERARKAEAESWDSTFNRHLAAARSDAVRDAFEWLMGLDGEVRYELTVMREGDVLARYLSSRGVPRAADEEGAPK